MWTGFWEDVEEITDGPTQLQHLLWMLIYPHPYHITVRTIMMVLTSVVHNHATMEVKQRQNFTFKGAGIREYWY